VPRSLLPDITGFFRSLFAFYRYARGAALFGRREEKTPAPAPDQPRPRHPRARRPPEKTPAKKERCTHCGGSRARHRPGAFLRGPFGPVAALAHTICGAKATGAHFDLRPSNN
jgi:hypothetical protein